jgi:hypothetical protein
MLIVRARRQLLFSKAGGRRSFRRLERLVRQPMKHKTRNLTKTHCDNSFINITHKTKVGKC